MAVAKRLIGEDGYLAKGTLGTEIVGDGILTIAKDAWVQVTAKAGTSGFGDVPVGQFFYAPAIIPGATLPAGDKWRVLTLEKFLDGVSWNLELSADEIDVTVNKDRFKHYRRGKQDASGSAAFLYIAGVTDKVNGLANKFFDIMEVSATGVHTLTAVDTSPIYLVGYLNTGKEVLDENLTVATIMQCEFFNFTLPSTMGEAGNMDIPFRLSGENDPILYTITLPVV